MNIKPLELNDMFVAINKRHFTVFKLGEDCTILSVPFRMYLNLSVSLNLWDCEDGPLFQELFTKHFGECTVGELSLRQISSAYEVNVELFYHSLNDKGKTKFQKKLLSLTNKECEEISFIPSPQIVYMRNGQVSD